MSIHSAFMSINGMGAHFKGQNAASRSYTLPCRSSDRSKRPRANFQSPLLRQSGPVICSGGGGGGRIYASKGFGGDGDSESGKRRPLISLTLAYAAFVAVGGVQGYRKAGSRNSLISSLVIAAALAAASYHLYINPGSYLGIFVALGIVAALGTFMAYGWYKNRKTFPQGVTAALSLALASSYVLVLKGT